MFSDEIRSLIEEKYPKYGIKASEVVYVMTRDSKLAQIDTPSAQLQFLSELITGALGVDRMDFLLRDSYHVGVQYGKFDLERLLNTLGVVSYTKLDGPQLGVELGGLHAAESLLVARYWMFLQVYHHDVRRIYDLHLLDYMSKRYKRFPVDDLDEYLRFGEGTVLNDITQDATKADGEIKQLAERIYLRKHFRAIEPVFYRPKFFDEHVVSEIENKIADLKPIAGRKTPVRIDKPAPEVYKLKHFERLFIFSKHAHDRDRPRSVLDESELLWNIRPITPCRIYVDPDEGELRGKIEEICRPLKVKEDELINEERKATRGAA